jgi:hypothetical protein
MKTVRSQSKLLAAVFFGFVLLLALPAVSMAQGRGHGNGRGQGSNWDNKCAKFVNCHDARDGRVDGRGPNRSTGISNIYRNRRYGGISDVIYGRTRTRRIDRDGDGDYDRNDVRIERQRRADRRYRRWNP